MLVASLLFSHMFCLHIFEHLIVIYAPVVNSVIRVLPVDSLKYPVDFLFFLLQMPFD